ncbi:hypothetical protein ACQ5SK_42390 [Bradyrhizobium japonicum]
MNLPAPDRRPMSRWNWYRPWCCIDPLGPPDRRRLAGTAVLDAPSRALRAGAARQNARAHGTRPIASAAQAAPAPPRTSGIDILGDAFGYLVLFGIIALFFQSRVPLYLGAFLFLSDGERIEHALGTIGIRLEPDTVGPDLIKGFASLFG